MSLTGVVLSALAAITGVLVGSVLLLFRLLSGFRADTSAQLSDMRIARREEPEWAQELREELGDLTYRARSMLREARSRESTATHAVRRARAELRESGAPADERLEELGEDLDLFDADGSEGSGVLPMRAHVGGAAAETPRGSASGAETDWESLARARKFGA